MYVTTSWGLLMYVMTSGANNARNDIIGAISACNDIRRAITACNNLGASNVC